MWQELNAIVDNIFYILTYNILFAAWVPIALIILAVLGDLLSRKFSKTPMQYLQIAITTIFIGLLTLYSVTLPFN